MDRLLLRPMEAAMAIGVGRSRMYELLASGQIPSVRIGTSVRVSVDALKAWIGEQASPAVHSPTRLVSAPLSGAEVR